MTHKIILSTFICFFTCVTPRLAAQQNSDSLYLSIATNLCLHIDSLGEISVGGMSPLLLPLELPEVSTYLSEDQMLVVQKWYDGMLFDNNPFVNTVSGTRTFSHLLETCPAAGERFFEQMLALAESNSSVDDSSFIASEEWAVLRKYTLEKAVPSALNQNDTMLLFAVVQRIKNDKSAYSAFSTLIESLETESLNGLLMAEAGRNVPGAALRFYPEKLEAKEMEQYLSMTGVSDLLLLIDSLDAQNDIDRFCDEWIATGDVNGIDTEGTFFIEADKQTKQLFQKFYSGPLRSKPVMALGPSTVIMTGVFLRCQPYKDDLKEKGITEAMKELQPSSDEKIIFREIADDLCGCLGGGMDSVRTCLDDLLKTYELTIEDLGPLATLSPEKDRIKTAVMTMLDGVALGCSKE